MTVRLDVSGSSRHSFEFLLAAAYTALVDLDSEPRAIGNLGMAARDSERFHRDILGHPRAGQGQTPGDGRRRRRGMQRRCRSNARLAGLAGNIHAHAEPVAQPAGFDQRAQTAELDRLEADAAHAALVMPLDVVARMDAFVSADGDRSRSE